MSIFLVEGSVFVYGMAVSAVWLIYSRTSEQRTLWDRGFCPLFRGCPLL